MSASRACPRTCPRDGGERASSQHRAGREFGRGRYRSSAFAGAGATRLVSRFRLARTVRNSCYFAAMSIDVVDLRTFYAQRLGVVARRFVGRGIRARFADTRGMSVLGVGYPTPYLGLFREEAERCLAFMPAVQGVVQWPTGRPGLAALVDELELPLADSSIDRVLLVHALEMAHDPGALLREVWRVLAAGGRLLVVVPNRRGVWARLDTTPFGHGRPYSRSQIMHLLRETWFTPTGWSEALHVPPVRAAGSCARRSPGNAPARSSPRRSRASTSSRRPSRSIARSRHGASASAWCRRSSLRSRRHQAASAHPASGCTLNSLIGACPFRKTGFHPDQVRGRLFPGHALSTTLADLLTAPLVANPFAAVRASLRRWSSEQ